MSQHYTLTIQPGFPDYIDPISRYVERKNFGSSMTIYKIDNEISALLAKKRLENERYIIHLERPNDTSSTTKHVVYHEGIRVGGNIE